MEEQDGIFPHDNVIKSAFYPSKQINIRHPKDHLLDPFQMQLLKPDKPSSLITLHFIPL